MEDYRPSPECVAVCETFKAVIGSHAAPDDGRIMRELGEAGLFGLLSPEAADGALPFSVAAEVMRAAGTLGCSPPLAETFLAVWLLGDHPVAAQVMSGHARITIAADGALRCDRRGQGWRLNGRVGPAPGGASSQWLLAWIDAPDPAFAVLDLSDPAVEVEDGASLDLGRSYDDVLVRDLVVDAAAVVRCASERRGALERRLSILRAAEMLGAAEACFELGQDRVINRRQFGKPLVLHQAIRHQLARDHLRLTGLSLSIAHAAAQCSQDPQSDEAALAQIVVSASAGETCLAAIENALQMHGALGFTWDVDLHRHLRRVRKLTQLCGPAAARAQMGRILWLSPLGDPVLAP